MDKQKDSLYLPYRMIIEKITDEAPGVRTFRLKFKEEREGEDFHFKAGQFGEYSAFGEGESLTFFPSNEARPLGRPTAITNYNVLKKAQRN